jgi:phosphoribosyl 1,2-cyclic phosphodiesterase
MPADPLVNNPGNAVIRFWGVRGSIPTPGASTVRYGGNTTCLELRINGQLIVIDAGSGIRLLGNSLMKEFADKPIELTLLNTHTHWDHIQGFPFFVPAFKKQNRIRIIARKSLPDGFKGVMEMQMDGTRCFPIPFGVIAAGITFEYLDPEGDLRFQIGDVQVEACPTNHPGGCLGYSFETSCGKIAVLIDHETGGLDEPRILEFIKGARVMIADAQYDEVEMASRRGWGHGGIKEVLSLALRAGVEQLYFFHHDPTHDDAFMDELVDHGRAIAREDGSKLFVDAAREGMEIVLE